MDKPDDDTIEALAEVIEPTRVQSTELAFPRNEPEDDFEFARQKIRKAMMNGEDALSALLIIARESNHPRAFEVLATTIKTITDSAKTLMDSKKTNVEITKAQGNLDDGTKTINNNLFVGSPADLQKMLDEFREKNGKD